MAAAAVVTAHAPGNQMGAYGIFRGLVTAAHQRPAETAEWQPPVAAREAGSVAWAVVPQPVVPSAEAVTAAANVGQRHTTSSGGRTPAPMVRTDTYPATANSGWRMQPPPTVAASVPGHSDHGHDLQQPHIIRQGPMWQLRGERMAAVQPQTHGAPGWGVAHAPTAPHGAPASGWWAVPAHVGGSQPPAFVSPHSATSGVRSLAHGNDTQYEGRGDRMLVQHEWYQRIPVATPVQVTRVDQTSGYATEWKPVRPAAAPVPPATHGFRAQQEAAPYGWGPAAARPGQHQSAATPRGAVLWMLAVTCLWHGLLLYSDTRAGRVPPRCKHGCSTWV